MFSKLVFTLDGQEVVFDLHELVRINEAVLASFWERRSFASSYKSFAQNLETTYVDRLKKHPEQLERDILQAISEMDQKYEKKYGIQRNLDQLGIYFAWNGQRIMNPFPFMVEVLSKTSMNFILTSGLFDAWNKTISFLESQEKEKLLQDDFGLRSLLPPAIKQINSAQVWLQLIRYVKHNTSVRALGVEGWWLDIAGHLVRLEHNIGERKHLYASDHGTAEQIIKDTMLCLESFEGKDEAGLNRAIFFWKRYEESYTPEDAVGLREEFILHRSAGFGGDRYKNAVLLQMLTCPREYRLPKETDVQFSLDDYPIWLTTDVRHRDAKERPWRRYSTKGESGKLSTLEKDHTRWAYDEREYKQFSAQAKEEWQASRLDFSQFIQDYKNAMEFNRFLGYETGMSFYSQLFEKAKGPFFTQLNRALHPRDAALFKQLYVLKELSSKTAKGIPNLIRPTNAFGSKHEGASYRLFSDAFESHFKQHREGNVTSSDVAKMCRGILQGQSIDEAPHFLPNLALALFLSEASRNEGAFLSGLMLLDLIESNTPCVQDGINLYTWSNVLFPPKSYRKKMVRDLYGDEIEAEKFYGIHPMVHSGSVRETDGVSFKSIMKEQRKLSVARQKEGHLTIHWLYRKIKERLPSVDGLKLDVTVVPFTFDEDEKFTLRNLSHAMIGWLREHVNQAADLYRSLKERLQSMFGSDSPLLTWQERELLSHLIGEQLNQMCREKESKDYQKIDSLIRQCENYKGVNDTEMLMLERGILNSKVLKGVLGRSEQLDSEIKKKIFSGKSVEINFAPNEVKDILLVLSKYLDDEEKSTNLFRSLYDKLGSIEGMEGDERYSFDVSLFSEEELNLLTDWIKWKGVCPSDSKHLKDKISQLCKKTAVEAVVGGSSVKRAEFVRKEIETLRKSLHKRYKSLSTQVEKSKEVKERLGALYRSVRLCFPLRIGKSILRFSEEVAKVLRGHVGYAKIQWLLGQRIKDRSIVFKSDEIENMVRVISDQLARIPHERNLLEKIEVLEVMDGVIGQVEGGVDEERSDGDDVVVNRYFNQEELTLLLELVNRKSNPASYHIDLYPFVREKRVQGHEFRRWELCLIRGELQRQFARIEPQIQALEQLKQNFLSRCDDEQDYRVVQFSEEELSQLKRLAEKRVFDTSTVQKLCGSDNYFCFDSRELKLLSNSIGCRLRKLQADEVLREHLEILAHVIPDHNVSYREIDALLARGKNLSSDAMNEIQESHLKKKETILKKVIVPLLTERLEKLGCLLKQDEVESKSVSSATLSTPGGISQMNASQACSEQSSTHIEHDLTQMIGGGAFK